jgi:hypothetical protein
MRFDGYLLIIQGYTDVLYIVVVRENILFSLSGPAIKEYDSKS